MPANQGLAERIANVLKDKTTHAKMAAVGIDIGLTIPEETEGASKRDRARRALIGKTDRELAETARRLGIKLDDYSLEEEGLAVLEADTPPITEITRRDVASCFGDNLAGERDPVDVVRELFPIGKMTAEVFSLRTVAEEMFRHMIRNPGDWSVEYLFEQIGALSCSRDRFSRLIEAALHPLGRRGTEQQALVPQLNAVLRRDGYELRVDGGSRLATLTFVKRASEYLRSGGDVSLLTRQTALEWLDVVRDRIFRAAELLGSSPRDLAATLVGCLVAPHHTACVHVGDGAIVVRLANTNEWQVGSWPSHGEYASTTYFVTDDPEPNVLVSHIEGEVKEVSLFTDGIERLVLEFASQTPFTPFFDRMFAPFKDTFGGRDRRISEQLRLLLESPMVCDKTDDDKTLFLAKRV